MGRNGDPYYLNQKPSYTFDKTVSGFGIDPYVLNLSYLVIRTWTHSGISGCIAENRKSWLTRNQEYELAASTLQLDSVH